MNLMLYSWNANNEQILADNLTRLGFYVLWFRQECRHYTRDMELAAKMIPYIHQNQIESVVSFNYFPIVSMICDTCKIPYYAWVYDCPHFTLYAKQIALPCNHIGVFDKELVNRLQEKGVRTVSHVPLCVDTEYFQRTLKKAAQKDKRAYECAISFVGSLYTDEHNYYDSVLDKQDREKLDALVRRQSFVYDRDFLREAIDSGEVDIRVIQTKMEKQGLMLGEDYFADAEDLLLAVVLEKKVTVEERRLLLTGIGERFGGDYRFCLYTASNLSDEPTLSLYRKGTVDYHRQMPLVFAGSKINLNISLRSIHSGIPLRVLDIMACGGFVLTNRQPEIVEYFAEGKEIATFGSMEECLDKITYYLTHESERRSVAEAGKKRVETAFCYRAGLERLLT